MIVAIKGSSQRWDSSTIEGNIGGKAVTKLSISVLGPHWRAFYFARRIVFMGAFKGTLGLIVAVVIVVVLLVAFPAYRWFFLISVAIGLVSWGILHFWHQCKPLRESDVENKRPLGLD